MTKTLLRLLNQVTHILIKHLKNLIQTNMKKLIVLNFSTAEVHVYTFDESTKEAEEVMEENNHNENDCQWMIVDEIKLTIH